MREFRKARPGQEMLEMKSERNEVGFMALIGKIRRPLIRILIPLRLMGEGGKVDRRLNSLHNTFPRRHLPFDALLLQGLSTVVIANFSKSYPPNLVALNKCNRNLPICFPRAVIVTLRFRHYSLALCVGGNRLSPAFFPQSCHSIRLQSAELHCAAF